MVSLLSLYFFTAYIAIPLFLDRSDTSGNVSRSDSITVTANGLPGDPINVSLIGQHRDLVQAFLRIGWYPANPLTLKSCVEIAEAAVLKRPYPMAPVSSLYLFNRIEDLAFEKPVGDSPRHRHHVRFWKTAKIYKTGSPYWYGSATFDRDVGFSKTTGQFTHHISANVDKERNALFSDLTKANSLSESFSIDDFQKEKEGHNGEGDRWFTDGRLLVGVLKDYRHQTPQQ